MKHTIREEDGVIVIALEGKVMGEPLDTALINMVDAYIQQNKVNAVMDYSKVAWINSMGLGICITILTSLRNRGGDLRLACVPEKVRFFLDRSRMFAVFESFDTLDKAKASFRRNT